MKKIFVFLIVVLAIFSLFFIFGQSFLNDSDSNESTVPDEPNKIGLYKLIESVEKSSVVATSHYEYVELEEQEVLGAHYDTASNLRLEPGAIYKTDVAKGALLTNDMIVNPSERDYIYLSIKNDEIPYFYEATGIGVVELFGLKAGDRVSFLSTSNSSSNSDYDNEGVLVSKVIVQDARVLQVIETDGSDTIGGSEKKYGLIVTIKTRDALKLEMAQKIGTINIIPSAFNTRYLSIRSSDIVEGQFNIRELRGN